MQTEKSIEHPVDVQLKEKRVRLQIDPYKEMAWRNRVRRGALPLVALLVRDHLHSYTQSISMC